MARPRRKNAVFFLTSFKARMLLFALGIALLPLLLYQLLTLRENANILSSTYAQELRHKTALTTLLIGQSVGGALTNLRLLAATLEPEPGDHRHMERRLRQVTDTVTGVQRLALFHVSGQLLAASGPGPERYDLPDSPAGAEGQVRFGGFLRDQGGMRALFFIPTHPEEYLVMEMGLGHLELLLGDFEEELEGNKPVYLLESDGHPLLPDAGVERHPDFSQFREVVRTGESAIFRYTDARGDPVLASVDTVTFPNAGEEVRWLVAASMPTAIIDGKVYATLKVLMLAGGVILLLTLLVGYLLSATITGPLLAVARVAKGFGRGHYDKRLSLASSISEIQVLSDTLNDMADRVDSHTRNLETQNRFIRFILDTNPTAIVIFSGRKPEYVNQTMLHTLGLPSEEAFADSPGGLGRFVHQVDEEVLDHLGDEEVLELLLNKQHIVHFRHTDGSVSQPFISAFAPLEGQDRAVYTFADVTMIEVEKCELADRVKVIEEERKAHMRMLEIQSRQAQMGEMIGSISHQWRQPLNILAIQIHDVREAFMFDEMDKTYVERFVTRASETIQYLSQTIDDFRNFFRPTEEKIRFQPKKAVEKILKIMEKRYLEERLEVTIEAPEELEILGVQNEFQQVMVNLFNNALDAYQEKGIQQRPVRVGISREEDEAVILVEDRAGGIPETALPHIFDAYYTTKDENKGTGIGLYMTRIIIEEKMGGSVTAENREDGARFTIRIPTAPVV